MLYPLLLIPVVLWVLSRYLRLLDGTGLPRLGLLLALVLGVLTSQVFQLDRALYPFTAWTMYSLAEPDPVYVELRVSRDGEAPRHFPWARLAPVQEVRGIHGRIAQAVEPPAVAAPGVEVDPASHEEFLEILQRLGELHHRAFPGAEGWTLEVRRCEVDPSRRERPLESPCPTVVQLRSGARHAP